MKPALKEIKVSELPPCDICRGVVFGQDNPNAEKAHYDGPTRMGAHAYMCDRHFKSAGTGYGVKLVLLKEAN